MVQIEPNIDDCLMKNLPDDFCPCVMEGVLNFLGKPWNIMILATLGNYPVLRYKELEFKLRNISPKTLSRRLKELVSSGFVIRKAYAEIPPRVEYSLSKDGETLYSFLVPLFEWASTYVHQN